MTIQGLGATVAADEAKETCQLADGRMHCPKALLDTELHCQKDDYHDDTDTVTNTDWLQ